MTSPETDQNASDNDVPKTAAEPRAFLPRKPGPWIAAGIIIGIPAILTIIGMVTAPPVTGVPTGHIIYLEADKPSEKTTMLHDMFSVGADGLERLITTEDEPQDVDAGAREWIIEPVGSPDGKRVAYVKEMIVLIEEKQSVDIQIWVADLTADKPSGGNLVYDLTANKLDQITHLVWTPDGKSLAFVEGKTLYKVPVDGDGKAPPLISQLNLPDEAVIKRPHVSPLALVKILPSGEAVCEGHGIGQVYWAPASGTPPSVSTVPEVPKPLTTGGVYAAAVSPDGKSLATVENDSRIIEVTTSTTHESYPVVLGWSVFGHRKIRSLRWSPDGRYVGYTASKPPVADDEMFYLDTQTGKYYKLPFRSGPASWDWSK